MELTETEIRVLGCLIEKERATPDQYPLTSNALRNACNQKTNREPIVDYGESEIDTTMLSLRAEGYARSITGSGRTVKHKQVLDEALSLSNGEISVLAVMMLRGPQTRTNSGPEPSGYMASTATTPWSGCSTNWRADPSRWWSVSVSLQDSARPAGPICYRAR